MIADTGRLRVGVGAGACAAACTLVLIAATVGTPARAQDALERNDDAQDLFENDEGTQGPFDSDEDSLNLFESEEDTQDLFETDEDARDLLESDEPAQGRQEEPGEEDAPSFAAVAFDAAAVRPLSFLRLVVGCAIGLPVAALALPAGVDVADSVIDVFVRQPYRDTFWDSLGEF